MAVGKCSRSRSLVTSDTLGQSAGNGHMRSWRTEARIEEGILAGVRIGQEGSCSVGLEEVGIAKVGSERADIVRAGIEVVGRLGAGSERVQGVVGMMACDEVE